MVSQQSGLVISRYATASAITALAYDIILYSDEEIRYIWRSAWSIPKVLYLSSRYYPIIYISFLLSVDVRANLPFNAFVIPLPNLLLDVTFTVEFCRCQGFWWYYGFGGLIMIVPLVNIILSLRVSALYGHTRKIISFLSFLFVVEFVGELITTTYVTIPDAANAISLAPGSGCGTKSSTNIKLTRLENLAWGVTLFGSFTLFALTIIKLWCYRKEALLGPSVIKNQRILESPLFFSLFRDGAFYFLVIFGSICLMMLGSLSTNPNIGIMNGAFRPWYIAIYSFSGSRLVLNLRRIAVEGADAPTDITAPIMFATFAARATISDEGTHPDSEA